MEIEIDETVLEILKKEAEYQGMSLEELVNETLRYSAKHFEFNNGKIKQAQRPGRRAWYSSDLVIALMII